MRGRVRRNGGLAVLSPAGTAIPAPDGPGLEDGREVVYGFRPEHLRLADEGFEAEVLVTEPTGSEMHILARHGEEQVVALFRERLDLRAGQRVRLLPDLDKAHLFDAESGRALRA
jgi:multiple sugar transport system ATP-binding protein